MSHGDKKDVEYIRAMTGHDDREDSWTTNKPKACGYYWWHADDGPDELVHIYYPGTSDALFVDNHGWLAEMPRGHFAGPLLPPPDTRENG